MMQNVRDLPCNHQKQFNMKSVLKTMSLIAIIIGCIYLSSMCQRKAKQQFDKSAEFLASRTTGMSH